MKSQRRQYELVNNIEHYLAVLSKLYSKDGETQKLEIIVNGQVRLVEEWTYDNWNGGTYGHALYFVLPEALFLRIVREKDGLRGEICKDLNGVHNVQNEYIEEVFIEMEVKEDKDWRLESGAMLSGERSILPQAQLRIWGEEGFRLFLSHKTEVKKQTAMLKKRLGLFGVSCFVAHEDIHPTKEWQNEIENALFSMDAFAALMTEEFHDSLWTDQEVGVAFGRGVPIIAVRLGKDPYGFIGKFQALTCNWDTAAFEIMKLLIRHPGAVASYTKAVKKCEQYNDGNILATILPYIENLTSTEETELIQAFNGNSQVRESYGFNGNWAGKYGDGLIYHLERITGRRYRISHGEIEVR